MISVSLISGTSGLKKEQINMSAWVKTETGVKVPKGCHTLAEFFVVELQIFCRGQIWLKFVGTSACRTIAVVLSRQTAFSLGAESISAMFEKRLVHVTHDNSSLNDLLWF